MENKEEFVESKQEGTLYQAEGVLKYKDYNGKETMISDEYKPTSLEQILYRTAKLLNKMDLAEIEVKIDEHCSIRVVK